MAHLVQVTFLLDVESESEAADGINEAVRELQKKYSPLSCIIDYTVDSFKDVGGLHPDYEEGCMANWVLAENPDQKYVWAEGCNHG